MMPLLAPPLLDPVAQIGGQFRRLQRGTEQPRLAQKRAKHPCARHSALRTLHHVDPVAGADVILVQHTQVAPGLPAAANASKNSGSAFPAEEPPSIECNEDAGQEDIDN